MRGVGKPLARETVTLRSKAVGPTGHDGLSPCLSYLCPVVDRFQCVGGTGGIKLSLWACAIDIPLTTCPMSLQKLSKTYGATACRSDPVEAHASTARRDQEEEINRSKLDSSEAILSHSPRRRATLNDPLDRLSKALWSLPRRCSTRLAMIVATRLYNGSRTVSDRCWDDEVRPPLQTPCRRSHG